MRGNHHFENAKTMIPPLKAGASRKCGGITVLELLRLENAKTVIPASGRGVGLGQAENSGESPFLRLENAKTVIPPHGGGGRGWGKQKMRGNHRFGAFEA